MKSFTEALAMVEHASAKRKELTDATIRLWRERDFRIDSWLDGDTTEEHAYLNELANAAELVDSHAHKCYDIANAVSYARLRKAADIERELAEQESDAAEWMQFTQELRHG